MDENFKLFKDTIETLSLSQGYYGRLKNAREELSENELENLSKSLPKFKDVVDVIMYIEG